MYTAVSFIHSEDNLTLDAMHLCSQLFILVSQFQFFNAFMSLFYIAFYLRDMERLKAVSMRNQIAPELCFRQAYEAGNLSAKKRGSGL